MNLNILNYNKKLYPLNITRKFLYILNNFLNKISISLLDDKIITKRLIRNIMELNLKLKNIKHLDKNTLCNLVKTFKDTL